MQQHFAARYTMKKTPEYDKLDVYFTTTQIPASSVLYRHWECRARYDLPVLIAPIKDLGIDTVTSLTAGPTGQPGGTDSASFSWIGLDGIGFMEDPLECGTRTHPSNMDLYDVYRRAM